MTTPHLPLATSSTSTPAVSTDRNLLHATIALVRDLIAMFPQLADGSVDRQAMLTQWAKGLADFTPADIETGMTACRPRRFAPSLGDFMLACRPWLEPEVAFLVAEKGLAARRGGQHGNWPHPAIYRAANTLNFEIRTRSYSEIKRRWEMEFTNELAAGWQEDVPAPRLRIEEPPSAPADPARVREILAKLRQPAYRDNQGTSK